MCGSHMVWIRTRHARFHFCPANLIEEYNDKLPLVELWKEVIGHSSPKAPEELAVKGWTNHNEPNCHSAS